MFKTQVGFKFKMECVLMQTLLILYTHDLIQTLKSDESAQPWHWKWSPSNSQVLRGNIITWKSYGARLRSPVRAVKALRRQGRYQWRLREASAVRLRNSRPESARSQDRGSAVKGKNKGGNNITQKEKKERKMSVEIICVIQSKIYLPEKQGSFDIDNRYTPQWRCKIRESL